ncbi:unnamed protein product [Effrenium voratum]|nr:unnamed protein product [Effrenium voratum]CAJ1451217.1 unnamed protein product [Effrenium voratum]
MALRAHVLLLLTSAAKERLADPICWAEDDGNVIRIEDHRLHCSDPSSSTFDTTLTHHRCCAKRVARVHRSSRSFLILSRAAEESMDSAAQCWPGLGLLAFDLCCDLRHGFLGRSACFANESRGDAWNRCCLSGAFFGLDKCNADYDPACKRQLYWPLPVNGLRGRILDHQYYFQMHTGSALAWDKVGQAQFTFLTHPEGGGLSPSSSFLDIACGSLRLGRWMIPWLQTGKYGGVDKARRLIEQGYWFELLPEDRRKAPRFAVTEDFDFGLLYKSDAPEVSWAHSLITHLIFADVVTLLTKLRQVVAAGHRFYATFVKQQDSQDYRPPAKSAANAVVRHLPSDLAHAAAQASWRTLFDSQLWVSVLRSVFGRPTRVERHEIVIFEAI